MVVPIVSDVTRSLQLDPANLVSIPKKETNIVPIKMLKKKQRKLASVRQYIVR